MMNEKKEYGILALLALLLITVVSTCSPLYQANPYSDANIYLAMGKAWLEGLIPYRDLYDQKGPIIYMLHAMSAMLSRTNFIGIYLLELVCCFFNLVYILRTLRLWMDHRAALPVAMAIGALTYCCIFMSYGDTVEEFSLPILTGSMYLFYRYAKLEEIPSRQQSLLMGLGISIIFWMKFTIVATFAGAGLATLIIAYHRKEAKAIWQCIGWATLGFAAVTAFVLLVFACYGAVKDLFMGYFFFNVFHYNVVGEGSAEQKMWWGYLVIYAAVLGLLALIPERKSMRLMIVLSIAATALLFVTIFCYFYYYETLMVFLPLTGIAFQRLKENKKLWIISILFTLILTFTDYNFRLLLEGRVTCFAASMAEKIMAEGEENPDVLTYNMLNTGIHVQTNAVPRIRYFFKPNSNYPEIMQQQNDYLYSRQAQWVVTTDTLAPELGYQHVMTSLDYDRGVGIDMFLHREICTPIYLYKRIDDYESASLH